MRLRIIMDSGKEYKTDDETYLGIPDFIAKMSHKEKNNTEFLEIKPTKYIKISHISSIEEIIVSQALL
ncbi:hypothetical protein [Sporolactobacillus sp. KGMB 08714]|uniref:hypothetical protein n=1 Tax=Sporolactobacillus sp. KGMB 08714 TaxID=3064704 RepID=UPI002FBE3787